MAGELKCSLLLSDENFRQRLEQDAKSVQQMGSQASSAAQSLAQMAGTLLQQTQNSQAYGRQMKMMQKQIVDLTINYRQLSDVEKQSRFGQDMLQTINQLTNKAAEFKDAMGDVQAEISKTSSDTQNYDAVVQGIDLVSNAMQTYIALTGDAKGENEEAMAVLASLAKVQTIANAAISVTNLLQKNSALMVGIRRIQEAALSASLKDKAASETANTVATTAGTASETANTVATTAHTAAVVTETTAVEGATVAQRIFNTVAKANPYVLLASAVLAVGAACVAYAAYSRKAQEEEKKAQQEAAKLKKQQEELKHEHESLGSKTGDLIGEFKSLQIQWKNLKTEAQKKQFIEDNKTAFNKLGFEVNNLNDAYNVLVKNAPKVIAALKAMAEAEAYKDLYKDSITKREKEWNNRQKSVATGDYYNTVKDSDRVQHGLTGPSGDWSKAGLKANTDYKVEYNGDYDNKYTLTKAGEAKLTAYRQQEARNRNKTLKKYYDDDVKHYGDAYDAALKKSQEAEAALAKTGVKHTAGGNAGKTSKTTKSTNKIDYQSGSLADIDAQISKLQDKIKKTDWTGNTKGLDAVKQKLADLEIAKKDLEDALEIDVNDSKLTKLQKELSKNEEMLQITPNLSDEDIKKIDDRIKKLKKDIEKEKIHLGLEDPKSILDDLNEQLNDTQKKLEITPDLSDEDIKKLNDKIAQIKNDIEKEKIHLGIEIDESALNLKDFNQDVTVTERVKTKQDRKNAVNPTKQTDADKADTTASNLGEQLRAHQQLLQAYQKEYTAIQQKVKAGVQLNSNEQQLKDGYEDQINQVNKLAQAYAKASVEAEQLNANATLSDDYKTAINGSIDALGNMTQSVDSVYSSWKSMGEQWNDMSDFEKTVSVIENCVSTLQTLSSVIDSVNNVIDMFSELMTASQAAVEAKTGADAEQLAIQEENTAVTETETALAETNAAAKESQAAASEVAASGTSAETAALSAHTATETSDTATTIASNSQKTASNITETVSAEGKSIADATSSGASLPFPANLVAIAAGVAAVIAAISMIASFADGGVVGGKTSMGDYNLIRANRGEMILNNAEQARMFRILNGTYPISSASQDSYGVTELEIRGDRLVGVVGNLNKKRNRLL